MIDQNEYPAGWDSDRVRKLIDHHESLTEDDEVAEDEAAITEHPGQTIIAIPDDLLPAVRQLLAAHKIA